MKVISCNHCEHFNKDSMLFYVQVILLCDTSKNNVMYFIP